MLDIVPQLFVNSLITGSIYALAGAGLALTFGIVRVLNFAHGHLTMVGGYLFLLAHGVWGLGLAPAALLTALGMAGIGMVTLRWFIVPFAVGGSFLPIVTTVALGTILESIVALTFGVNVQAYPSSNGVSLAFGGAFVTPLQIIIVTSAVLILGTLGVVVHSTGIGRQLRALAENPASAESLGIDRRGTTYGVGIAVAILAAYAGILIGFETSLQPTMGGSYTIKAFAAMVLGGLGNIWGTVVGAYILGFIENFGIGLDIGGVSLPAGYKDAFAFVIILGVLLIRPGGLFGNRRRAA